MAFAADLPADHPGFTDPEYRRRRDDIAAASAAWEPGSPIPDIGYTDAEHEVWRTVRRMLDPLHQHLAAREVVEGAGLLDLPADRIPQLADVDRRLSTLTDFGVRPVPGLVPTRTFYGSLADRTFLSTQYLRHHSTPLYTPEPDVVHEVIGHCTLLAHPTFAELHAAAGRCARRCETDGALEFFSRVFWFTLEFGVIREDDSVKAYGAGLISSYGEIQVFAEAQIRPFDVHDMGVQEYDITHYQPVLYSVGSVGELADRLGHFFDHFDDEAHARLLHTTEVPSP